MCLILLAVEQHTDYPLIIAANRDEFYQRPTKAMHWWSEQAVLAGKDLQAGGSWFATHRNGRFAAVTNYREVPAAQGQLSRGQLPLQWLNSELGADAFYRQFAAQQYAGVNLLYGDLRSNRLYHLSNRSNSLTAIDAGIHGLSNALINSPWPKITSAKAPMQQLLQQPFNAESWFALLASQEKAADDQLPDTGVGKTSERLLSSRFIHSDDYGTRCSTVLTVDRQSVITVFERSFSTDGIARATQCFRF